MVAVARPRDSDLTWCCYEGAASLSRRCGAQPSRVGDVSSLALAAAFAPSALRWTALIWLANRSSLTRQRQGLPAVARSGTGQAGRRASRSGGQPSPDHGRAKAGGPDGSRTRDLMNAIHARSQLRYWPTFRKAGLIVTQRFGKGQTQRDGLTGPVPGARSLKSFHLKKFLCVLGG